ncbi:hypothetical protein WJX73_007088 [Symbiochloris irregularis]|uniref:Major facilitator superfamily (MFS) profile domain-containing protein n=1 Tax=Symbiochloris irregularis TaxID=706552 RepID=A0AAW1PW54_9CHLO
MPTGSETGEPAAGPRASWSLSPGRLLALFCCMELLVYIDRGVMSSNGVLGSLSPQRGVQGDFHLTLPQLGLLPGAFMLGLLIASPLFAKASEHFSGLRLIACGLGIWALAAAGCGLSIGFYSLLLCRMVVGVGEASFVALAAPFIDDSAPQASKTRWLATFYVCIPSGYALGYLIGGSIAVPLGWRAPFLLEACIMLPFLILLVLLPPIKLAGRPAIRLKMKSGQQTGCLGRLESLMPVVFQVLREVGVLLQHPVYVILVLAYSIYTAVIGAYAFLGPKAGTETFKVPGSTSDYVFGGVTVLTGAAGTLAGGFVLDYLGSTIANAMVLCGICCIVGGGFVIAAFALTPTLATFVAPFALGELGLFALQAPVNAVSLWSVPKALRPLAMSLSVVVIHLLGDVPSPALLGWLQDRLLNWRLSMSIATATLAGAGALFFVGAWVSGKYPDYRKEDDAEGGDAEESTGQHAALLSNGNEEAGPEHL